MEKRVGLTEVNKVSNMVSAVKKKEKWNDFFVEGVDETLKQIFRDDGTKVIYDFLESDSKLTLKELSDKPEIFSTVLKKLMVSAAQVIEQAILQNLYSKLGIEFEEKQGYKFSDHVQDLRSKNDWK